VTTSCRESRPNIVYALEGAAVADYLESLAKVRDLDVDEIMPPTSGGSADSRSGPTTSRPPRARLGELLAAIAANPDATSWTWRPLTVTVVDQYSGRMRISAVTETAAHVIELVSGADQLKRA